MYNFERIYSLNESLKTCLENDYGLIYITQRIHNQGDEVFNNSDEDNYLELFFIPKKEPFIIEKITSIDGLKEVQKEIKKYYNDFLKNFGNYFEQVESQLDEKTNESFEIIYKIIQNRKKKLFSKLDKFEIEDDWNIQRTKKEFLFHIQKNLKDIIKSIIDPILSGIKENSAYDGIIEIFNNFLSSLGIYTKTLQVGYKLKDEDFYLINPIESEDDVETTDLNKKDVIKEIIHYPYLINEQDVILEGEIILWRIKHNG